MLGLANNRNLSIILNQRDESYQSNSSSDGDDAEKFKKTFLKNKNSSKFMLL